MPNVYNKRHTYPADAVYVGRPSDWGNPFRAGRDGTREEVIAKFESYALAMLKRKPDWLDPLRGKDLVCWCAPLPCHADVLLRMANDTTRPFSVQSNRLTQHGFRVCLCAGDLHEDGTVRLTQTFNKVINARTGKRDRVDLLEQYASMDALLKALETQDVRCIYWQDTKEYQFINKE